MGLCVTLKNNLSNILFIFLLALALALISYKLWYSANASDSFSDTYLLVKSDLLHTKIIGMF